MESLIFCSSDSYPSVDYNICFAVTKIFFLNKMTVSSIVFKDLISIQFYL